MRQLGLLLAVLALAGCTTTTTTAARPPAVDVSGRWIGTWIGYGIIQIPRDESAIFDLTQHGATGEGLVVLDNTGGAEAVPLSIRHAGMSGVRVRFEVSGSDVVLTHELGRQLLTADLTVNGDSMVGRIRNSDPAVRLVLTRAKPDMIKPGAEAVPPPPPPPGPEIAAPPAAPEPPKGPEVVMAPPPSPSVEPPSESARPAPRDFVRTPEVKTIYFDFDKADIRQADVAILDANAQYLKDHAELLLIVEGHCDERGTNEYNLALGERRAKTARDYLVSRGIAADRITTVSFGEERPVCSEQNEACWRQNRRAEFLVKPR
jgi:peptidoglycan-associated lipoprotein